MPPMKKKYLLPLLSTLVLCTGVLGSCVNMDIPPKNIVTSSALLSSESGMEIYMSRMYSTMPIEDFKYQSEWGVNYNGWLNATGIEGTGEAVQRDGICKAFTGENNPYWRPAFALLRDANYLIENLPTYRDAYSEEKYNHYLGEAYYVRATVFYAMARRFGGVPLVTRVIPYPAESDELEVPRSTEEETWDQVLADFDKAASLLMPQSPKRSFCNKYKALAYKSEAMLYAGSVAKYNETVSGRLTDLGAKTGVRVIGFEEGRWKQASQKYFSEAYKAAQEVIKSGRYALYKKKWAANDPEAQYENMKSLFTDLESPENIDVKEYIYPTSTHAYDSYTVPFTFRSPLSAGVCPTADFVELFDGFEHYDNGTLRVTDGVDNAHGHYILYERPLDFFKNAEPRLRAYVIFPGDYFKGKKMDIRAGVYTGSTPIKPLFSDYSYSSFSSKYQHLDIYRGNNKQLYLSPRENNNQEVVPLKDGGTMLAAGEEGPFYENGEATVTGMYGRKWLKDDPSFTSREGNSDQHFILMRYAEVLLNAAESAIELSLAGVPSPDGSDLLTISTDAINAIRERAGATRLEKRLTADIESRNIVRKERRKELAFENKIKWDLRRWRVNHYETRDGFWGEIRDKNLYSDNSDFRFRGLYPFYSTEAGKYFYDVRFQWVAEKRFRYTPLDYYFEIPGNEVAKSPVIDQQPNR